MILKYSDWVKILEASSNFSTFDQIIERILADPTGFYNKFKTDSVFMDEVLKIAKNDLNTNWDKLEKAREEYFIEKGKVTVTTQSPDAPKIYNKGVNLKDKNALAAWKAESEKLKAEGKKVTWIFVFLPDAGVDTDLQNLITSILSKL
jgi:hypothetical protein